MTDSATYSLVKDDQGKVLGLWLRNQSDTENRTAMAYLLTKHDADKDMKQRILMGFYEVRPNDVDEQGGFFVLITDRNPRIAKTTSTSEFVSCVLLGAVLVECEATIPEAIRTFDEVGHTLKGLGMETSSVVSCRERCFSTVCLKCRALLNGAAIGTVNLMRAENDGAPIMRIKQERDMGGQLMTIADLANGNNLTVRGPGRVLRFYMGKCSNEPCESDRVTMRWIDTPLVTTSQLKENPVFTRSDEKADWSTIKLCHKCGAGNPVNATECIRCKEKLSLPKQHPPARYLNITDTETNKVFHVPLSNIPKLDLEVGFIDHVKDRRESQPDAEDELDKFWQWLYERRIALLVVFLCIAFLAGFIFQENLYIVFIIAFIVAGFVIFICLVETEAIREAKRAERQAEREKRDLRNKQINLNRDIERMVRTIKKQIERDTPLENVLPNVRIKDYKALAKTISSIDFIKDTDKPYLFKKMNSDFISNVLAYFSEAETITVLKQLEAKKRDDVLMRFSLHKRSQLKSHLQI